MCTKQFGAPRVHHSNQKLPIVLLDKAAKADEVPYPAVRLVQGWRQIGIVIHHSDLSCRQSTATSEITFDFDGVGLL